MHRHMTMTRNCEEHLLFFLSLLSVYNSATFLKNEDFYMIACRVKLQNIDSTLIIKGRILYFGFPSYILLIL